MALCSCGGVSDFYPRSPCGERRCYACFSAGHSAYFYPRSPCGERPRMRLTGAILILFLSTLSLRRATCVALSALAPKEKFLSTLSLRRATVHALKLANPVLFLSTLSLRRATMIQQKKEKSTRHFYPRSPCGERPTTENGSTRFDTFLSTLSLRRATFDAMQIIIVIVFLSTLSLRRATTLPGFLVGCIDNFYPRSPCGERHNVCRDSAA